MDTQFRRKIKVALIVLTTKHKRHDNDCVGVRD